MTLACLLGRPSRRFHPGLSKLVHVPRARWPFVEDAIYEVCGHSTEYCHAAGGATPAARRHRRRLTALGLAYGPEAAELERRLDSARRFAEGLAADGGAACQPQGSAPHLERWAPDSMEPVAPGDMLFTHPTGCLFQRALDRAVILIDEVDAGGAHVRGIVLNKPDGATVGEALASWPAEERERAVAQGLEPLFGAALYTGGDLVPKVGGFVERVCWLHQIGDKIPGARRVAASVWIGGDLVVAAKLVAAGEVSVQSLRPLVGFAGWARQQLALELQRGVWVRSRMPAPVGLPKGFSAWPWAGHGEAVWRDAVFSAGLPALASFPRGDGIDGQLREWMEAHWQAQVEEMIAMHAEDAGTSDPTSN